MASPVDVATLPEAVLSGCTPEQFQLVLQAVKGDTAAATALCSVFTTSDVTEELRYGVSASGVGAVAVLPAELRWGTPP